jgi:hypothetical protein
MLGIFARTVLVFGAMVLLLNACGTPSEPQQAAVEPSETSSQPAATEEVSATPVQPTTAPVATQSRPTVPASPSAAPQAAAKPTVQSAEQPHPTAALEPLCPTPMPEEEASAPPAGDEAGGETGQSTGHTAGQSGNSGGEPPNLATREASLDRVNQGPPRPADSGSAAPPPPGSESRVSGQSGDSAPTPTPCR